jgi:c-di-GMP-binding flagellar brake protein YcgR
MGRYILAGDGSLIVERRATPRYDVSLNVEIGVWADNHSIQGMTTNLSEDGLQVVLPSPVVDGGLLRIECETFGALAEVMWSRKEEDRYRLGLKFISLTSKDRIAVRDLITNLRREQEGAEARSA